MGQSRGSNPSANSCSSRLSWSGYIVCIIAHRGAHIATVYHCQDSNRQKYGLEQWRLNIFIHFKLLFNWPSALSNIESSQYVQ